MASGRKWQGARWIRRERRLAIYLRDGAACVYCGSSLEDGAILSLDHLRPVSAGGGNSSRNLVTACRRCNSARGDRPLPAWLQAVAAYLNHGIAAKDIAAHIARCRRRRPPMAEARAIMARRASWAAALEDAATSRA